MNIVPNSARVRGGRRFPPEGGGVGEPSVPPFGSPVRFPRSVPPFGGVLGGRMSPYLYMCINYDALQRDAQQRALGSLGRDLSGALQS